MDDSPTLTVELGADPPSYRPGDRIDGVAGWQLDKAARWVEVRLFWRTAGKGDEDAVIVDSVRYDEPGEVDARAFSFVAPTGPFSYEGRLIEIAWGVEVVARRAKQTARITLTLSSTGEAVRPS
ncbi:MAG: hypothetical protein AAGG38_05090 [Planctomycetota bacterium]